MTFVKPLFQKIVLLIGLFFLTIMNAITALAQKEDSPLINLDFVPEENILIEILDFFVVLIAFVFVLYLIRTFRGGELERSWKYFIVFVTLIFFAELSTNLSVLGIVSVGGLPDLLDLIAWIFFVFGLYNLRKSFTID